MRPTLAKFTNVGIPCLIEELHVPSRTLGIHGRMAACKQIRFESPTVILPTNVVISIDTIQAETGVIITLELSINAQNVILWYVKELVVIA